MFGKKEVEKRSLEDMFKPMEDAELSDEVSCEGEVVTDIEKDAVENTTEYNSEPIKPLSCFGMEEGKTEKWLMKCVKVWFCAMSFMWFLFGATTFAPVIYISNKVNVIFKDKKKSLMFAGLVHGILLLIVALFIFLR